MPSEISQEEQLAPQRKRDETLTFVFLAVFLAPLLSVVIDDRERAKADRRP